MRTVTLQTQIGAGWPPKLEPHHHSICSRPMPRRRSAHLCLLKSQLDISLFQLDLLS